MTADEGSEVLSSNSFPTLKEFIDDAKTHRYVVPDPERRVNTKSSRLGLCLCSAKRSVNPANTTAGSAHSAIDAESHPLCRNPMMTF